jgi:hypothetical protein
VEKYGTARQAIDDIKIRRMCFVCWINKATEKHPEYVTLIAAPRQQWFCERASIPILFNFINVGLVLNEKVKVNGKI